MTIIDSARSTARWAVVTGASSGIGAGFARALSGDGFAVLLVARDRDALDAVAAGLPGPADVLAADLSTPDGLARVEARLRAQPMRLLVNNAATGRWGPFAEHDPGMLERTVAVNVVAPARLARAVLPGMIAAGCGGVITVSSPAGARPAPMLAVYGASKAFLDALDVSLRAELDQQDAPGVTVTTVWPGWTRTRFHARLDQDVTDVAVDQWADPDTVAAHALRRHRLGHDTVRVPEPRWRARGLEHARGLRRRLPPPLKALAHRLRALRTAPGPGSVHRR